MKKINLILITSMVISFSVSAQVAGDYRSKGSGNWNDATKWEKYDGVNWVTTTTYPGQSPGVGAVTITPPNEIRITQNVPYPIASLLVDAWVEYDPEFYCLINYQYGYLTFSAQGAVSLWVSGDVIISGELKIENQNGAKSHLLYIGGRLSAGTIIDDFFGSCGTGSYAIGGFQTVNQDDNLKVIFNTTDPGSWIWGASGISFYDVTFNGTGITLYTPIHVSGTASFINGIITANGSYNGGSISFMDGATAYGASNNSFLDGVAVKFGNDPFTFPIGDGGIYAPLSISAVVDSQAITARYTRSSAAALGAITDPGLYSISNCEYWTLYHSSCSQSLEISVGWSSVSGCGSSPYITNVSDVKLAYFDETTNTWGTHGGTSVGTTSNGSVTWTRFCGSGRYTLANLSTNCTVPSGLASTISTTTATVRWSNVSGSESYDVEYRANPFGSFINAATGITSTSTTLSNLVPTVTYEWRVRANCGSTSSAYRQAGFTTLPACGSPSGLTTTNITTGAATLNWQAVPNAISYDVQHKRSSYSSNYWENVATATTLTSVNVTGLQPWISYDWRVRANCTEGPGNYTQTIYETPAACDTPTGLKASNISFNSATVSWNPVPTAGYYNVAYKESAGTTWTPIWLTGVSYNLVGLTPATQYDWLVMASCIVGSNSYVGGISAHSTFTTKGSASLCNDNYESNETSATARTIILGSTISALISSLVDVDWFKVSTPGNSSGQLKVSLSNLPADYDVYVYNKNGALLGSSTTNTNETVTFYVQGKNTIYIKVVGKNGAYNSSQCYNLLAHVSNSARLASGKPYSANEVLDISDKELFYPNPASEFVMLHFNSIEKGSANIQILNTAGQLIKQYGIKITKGYNQVKVPVNDVRRGMYLLKISNGKLNMIRKFVIAR